MYQYTNCPLSLSFSMGCTLTPGHKSGVERKSNEPDMNALYGPLGTALAPVWAEKKRKIPMDVPPTTITHTQTHTSSVCVCACLIRNVLVLPPFLHRGRKHPTKTTTTTAVAVAHVPDFDPKNTEGKGNKERKK